MCELPVECRLQATGEPNDQDDDGEETQEQRDETEDKPTSGVNNRGRSPVAHGADEPDDGVGCLVCPVWVCQRIAWHGAQVSRGGPRAPHKAGSSTRQRRGSAQQPRPSNDRAIVGLIGHGLTADVVDADNDGHVEEAGSVPQGRPDDPSDEVT